MRVWAVHLCWAQTTERSLVFLHRALVLVSAVAVALALMVLVLSDRSFGSAVSHERNLHFEGNLATTFSVGRGGDIARSTSAGRLPVPPTRTRYPFPLPPRRPAACFPVVRARWYTSRPPQRDLNPVQTPTPSAPRCRHPPAHHPAPPATAAPTHAQALVEDVVHLTKLSAGGFSRHPFATVKAALVAHQESLMDYQRAVMSDAPPSSVTHLNRLLLHRFPLQRLQNDELVVVR